MVSSRLQSSKRNTLIAADIVDGNLVIKRYDGSTLVVPSGGGSIDLPLDKTVEIHQPNSGDPLFNLATATVDEEPDPDIFRFVDPGTVIPGQSAWGAKNLQLLQTGLYAITLCATTKPVAQVAAGNNAGRFGVSIGAFTQTTSDDYSELDGWTFGSMGLYEYGHSVMRNAVQQIVMTSRTGLLSAGTWLAPYVQEDAAGATEAVDMTVIPLLLQS